MVKKAKVTNKANSNTLLAVVAIGVDGSGKVISAAVSRAWPGVGEISKDSARAAFEDACVNYDYPFSSTLMRFIEIRGSEKLPKKKIPKVPTTTILVRDAATSLL